VKAVEIIEWSLSGVRTESRLEVGMSDGVGTVWRGKSVIPSAWVEVTANLSMRGFCARVRRAEHC